MEKLELRVAQSSLVASDDGLIVEGLVNKTESWSHTLGQRKKFREKITRGAFGKAIQLAKRIDFLAEHDSSKILSTTENGSLEIWEDEEGLKIRAKICPTSYGRDMYELMSHHIVNHMSFGFRAISDKWKKLANGTFERTIDALELMEVSVVRNPAYPQSAIAARGIELVEEVDIPKDVLEERSQEEMDNEQIQELRDFMKSINDRFDNIEKILENRAKDNVKEEDDEVEENSKDKEKCSTESDETKTETKADDKSEDEEEAKETKADDSDDDKKDDEDDKDDDKKEEGRSYDLASFRARVKERR